MFLCSALISIILKFKFCFFDFNQLTLNEVSIVLVASLLAELFCSPPHTSAVGEQPPAQGALNVSAFCCTENIYFFFYIIIDFNKCSPQDNQAFSS